MAHSLLIYLLKIELFHSYDTLPEGKLWESPPRAALEDQMFDVMRQSDVTFTATGSKASMIWFEGKSTENWLVVGT